MKLTTRLLISLGAAQALMIGNWSRMFDPGLAYNYAHPPMGMVSAAYALTFVLAVLAFVCTYLPPVFRWLIIPVALLMADNTRVGLGIHIVPFAFVAVALLAMIFAMVRKGRISWLRSGTLTLELLGYTGIVMPVAGLVLLRPTTFAPRQPHVEQKTGPRIVVVVFDELDPVHSIEKWPKCRPENEFIKASRNSLFFADCLQPGPETMYSLPALTIGDQVDKARPSGDSRLNLIVGGQKREWAEKPNILLEARDMVGASAMGWYHPYDREFPGVEGKFYERISDDPVFCFWLLFDFIIQQPFYLFGKNGQTKMLNQYYADHQRDIIEDFHKSVPEFIQSHYGLIFLHAPCPHVPYVMHPVPGDPLGFDPQSYYGAAEYAGEIYRTIEESLKKQKEPYTLIATSDHNLRATLNGIPPCGRVPMIITGTNIRKPETVRNQAYGEHVADVVRLLIAKPKATESEIVAVMTKPR